MPVYMEISRLHRTVTIVARGAVNPDEIRAMAQRLADAKVRSFAKIVEVAGARTEMTAEQVAKVAALLRGASSEKRGPVAFVVDPARIAFPQAFAQMTVGEGPISIFKSLREARSWLERIEHSPMPSSPEEMDRSPWSDPDRKGVLFRGDRQRDVTVNQLAEYVG
jgi:hypothetical protein